MRKYLYIILIQFFVLSAKGQDIYLSHHEGAPQYLNPALTGMYFGERNDYRFNINYSAQSIGSFNNLYHTAALGFDKKIKKFGLGAFLINNQAGEGHYNMLNFLVSGAYEISIDKTYRHNLLAGIQLGFFHHSVNPDKLYFGSQYDDALGGFNTSTSNGEEFYTYNVLRIDAALGGYYYYKDRQKPFNPFVGIGVYHASAPNISFYDTGEKNYYPIKFNIYGGCGFNLNEKFQVKPRVLFIKQGSEEFIDGGLIASYEFNRTRNELIIGASVNTSDLMYVQGGFRVGGSIFRVSYGFNSILQNSVNATRSDIEFSLILCKRSNTSASFYSR